MKRIPLGDWINDAVDWLDASFGSTLRNFAEYISENILEKLSAVLTVIPWWLLILFFVALAWRVGKWRLSLGTFLGLFLVYNLELWPVFIETLVLVLVSAFVSTVIGIPLGIWAARSNRFHHIITPVLDFMQTMPAFVYLIPALMFFGLGAVPSIFATVIFAMPPVIRLTDLGIRQVPVDLVEVGVAFGSTPMQLLRKIQLPVAMPTIMAGINQTMMLSLSMVVIASMIGAGGFGEGVLYGIAQMNVGVGFENGVAVVILAIILDRLSQGVGNKKRTEH
jgi:glycine betaine/proline transport system permease protein